MFVEPGLDVVSTAGWRPAVPGEAGYPNCKKRCQQKKLQQVKFPWRGRLRGRVGQWVKVEEDR